MESRIEGIRIPIWCDEQATELPALPSIALEPTLLDHLTGRRRASSLGGAIQFTAQFGGVSVELDSSALTQMLIDKQIERIMKDFDQSEKEFKDKIAEYSTKLEKLGDTMFEYQRTLDEMQKSELPAVLFPDERANPRLQPPAAVKP